MVLDLFLAFWLILLGLLGFRDGVVRKLVALVFTTAALIVGQLTMRSAGDLLIESLNADPSNAPMLGFLVVFIGIILVQSILYKVLTDSYKIGGIADRAAGSTLGVVQGVIFVSALLYILSYAGVPSRKTRADSRIYRSVVNVAPQILDLFGTIKAESLESLEKLSADEQLQKMKRMVRPGSRQDTSGGNRVRSAIREQTQSATSRIDSLRALQRR